MKRFVFALVLLVSLQADAQSVFGYWYGYANVKTKASASNYLVELVLQPEPGHVKGVLNYYFKNTYRSLQVKGNYDPKSRQLRLYNIPLTYFGSIANMEVDCMVDLQGTLRVAQAGSNLVGSFVSQADYKYMCGEVGFNLTLNADISKKDSVLQAIAEYKETYQVWKPEIEDTLVATTAIQRKVVNYVTEKEFTERKTEIVQEIEVESDSLRISLYDNGEIDGDMISLFYNKELVLNNQKLTHKSIRMNIVLDSTKEYNEMAMFAENLGLIPPNTALLIVEDGKNRFEIRVSSNLEKSGTIRIRRKKK